jgi:biotin-dependent carboxylase-like uncharacterized protein
VITVVRAGPLTTVQDLGRPGWAHLGVPRSGAADAPALRLANRLAGNPEGAAGLETTLLGCAVTLAEARWVAVTGAAAPVTVAGRPVGVGAPVRVPAGATVDIGAATGGLRSYLAVGGGLAVPATLGSRSADRLSGLGPPPLADGDTLPVGPPPGPPGPVDLAPPPPVPAEPVLRLALGPRDDWLASPAALRGPFAVSADSDRIGVRLLGPALERSRDDELPSEPLVLGALQLPADGRPVLFLADHPTTGGYPVVGVVHPADLPLAAQARPGTTLRFRVVRPRGMPAAAD